MIGLRTIIKGTGCAIPPIIKKNEDFSTQVFFNEKKEKLPWTSQEINHRLTQITGIQERRYADDSQDVSDLGTEAAIKALFDAQMDKEDLDQIIVAHNFGVVRKGHVSIVPTVASRIKHKLGINNPNCVAFDLLYGSPGWVQALIQADALIKSGYARKCLIIAAETLSRVIDPVDRDSMIFADGAGAAVVVGDENQQRGIIAAHSATFAQEEIDFIGVGASYDPQLNGAQQFVKMKGRKVYEFALKNVPNAMKQCFDKTNLDLKSLKKIFIHQANEKMDEKIISRFFKLYGYHEVPENIMPISIHKLGNSSVATVPTLLDLVRKQQLPPHEIHEGDIILFASVGTGMNVNAVCYKV